ncbi:phospho-sugar mutase [Lacrimispora sp. 210928-DFI.3.58]|uniref:phospho-sugar mutase n=1 Tax=Lacrimispora sp. 210928-DFI.3.58 TaxID=2883214 RepID=UPI002ED42048
MDKNILKEYRLWMEKVPGMGILDEDVINELKNMDEKQMEDAFYRELTFGTGGLRGIIGAGTNRMNIYTVAKASQGLANYIIKHFSEEERRVAVSYDSRIKSDIFARIASEVFAANGIKIHIYSELMPTPCLSFAVRKLKCSAGIMITASHNPSKYNGYKVYGPDGCQITTEAAKEIFGEIERIDLFNGIKSVDFHRGMLAGDIQYISEEVYTDFVEHVKKESVLKEEINKDVSIIYSPLNGTGLKPVLRTLKEAGYTNITVVKEQEQPDGHFPTCPYPNPEVKEAMSLGIEYAKRYQADLVLATDPDCDRVGIAVRNDGGSYVLLSANETGLLLLDYICSQRQKNGTMPEDPIMMKTIVTTDMAERIAGHYGVKTINVLTGFKFIGEQIGRLESIGKKDSYIFGFEESYGYLSGSYVRDKDGVNGAFLICEMFAYYKSNRMSLLEKLDKLYNEYGYYMNTLHSYEFEGSAGFLKMQEIMKSLRKRTEEIAGRKVMSCLDYLKGLDGLPKSDVLKYLLEGNCSVVVRPSGTEPKLKIYISVSAKNRAEAECIEESMIKYIEDFLNN